MCFYYYKKNNNLKHFYHFPFTLILYFIPIFFIIGNRYKTIDVNIQNYDELLYLCYLQ